MPSKKPSLFEREGECGRFRPNPIFMDDVEDDRTPTAAMKIQEAQDRLERGRDREWIDEAEKLVMAIVRQRGEGQQVTADAAWTYVNQRLDPPAEPRAMGSVFSRLAKKGILVNTGKMRKSQRLENHGRRVTVWEIARIEPKESTNGK